LKFVTGWKTLRNHAGKINGQGQKSIRGIRAPEVKKTETPLKKKTGGKGGGKRGVVKKDAQFWETANQRLVKSPSNRKGINCQKRERKT